MAFQPHAVQPAKNCPVTRGNHIRRNVLYHSGFSAHKRIIANPYELMNRHKSSHRGIIADGDMSCKGRIICHCDVPANFAVMGNMGIGHQKIFFSHFCQATAKTGSPVNGDKLTDNRTSPDLNMSFPAFKFYGLGNRSDGGKLKDMTIRADGHIRFNHGMGADDGTGTDKNIFPDNCIRTDFNIGIQFRFGVNDCCWMLYHNIFSLRDAMNSASATLFPSTIAMPDIFIAFERALKSRISSIS